MSYERLETDDLPMPVSGKHSTSSWMARARAKTRLISFIATAAASGILFHMLLIGFGAGPTGGVVVPEAKDWWPEGALHSTDNIEAHVPPPLADCSTEGSHPFVRPGLGQYVTPHEDEWTFDRVRDMVSRTKGYYARDYSLSLGWNNVGGSFP